jgi:hypothetical protein
VEAYESRWVQPFTTLIYQFCYCDFFNRLA